MSLSIFAKLPFLNARDGHMMRVSSMIRGIQIVEHTGAKLNPLSGYEDDTCIYVKPHVKMGESFAFSQHSYLDIIDGFGLVHLLSANPSVGCVVCSGNDFKILSQICDSHLVLIPQHHCNFERAKHYGRCINDYCRVGMIGTREAFYHLPVDIDEKLDNIGMKLIRFYNFFRREDVVNFYLDIDIQIVWRPYHKSLSNPLKIVNGLGFGIPTVALKEDAFSELDGFYIPVHNEDQLISKLDILGSSARMYEDFSAICLQKSEEYHIDRIAKMYLELGE